MNHFKIQDVALSPRYDRKYTIPPKYTPQLNLQSHGHSNFRTRCLPTSPARDSSAAGNSDLIVQYLLGRAAEKNKTNG